MITIYKLPAVPKRAVTVLTVAGLIAAGAIVFATQSSSAGTISVTNTDLDGLNGVAVDSVHHELFTTNWQGAVDVIDFTGRRIGYVNGDDLSGGGGLALSADASTLYVTVANKHEIAAVNTTTYKVIAEYPVGDSVMPRQIARAGHTLWFGWVTALGAPAAGAGIGTLDLTDPTHTVTTWTQVGGTDLIQAPLLTADPGNPDRLALCDPNGGIAVRLIDVSTGTPVQVASRAAPSPVTSLAFSPDGTRLYDNGGASSTAEELNATDLSLTGAYPGGHAPAAVAVAADGTIAVGHDSDEVTLYKPGNTTPIKTVSLDQYGSYFVGSRLGFMAFEPGSTRIITIDAVPEGPASFQLLNDDRVKAATTLTLTVPASVPTGQIFPISGKVTATLNGVTTPVADAQVEIDVLKNSGPLIRDYVNTGADGTYKSSLVSGTAQATYEAIVREDLHHGPATATGTVESRNKAQLTLDHNNVTYNYGTTVTFTAHFADSYIGRTVAIWADPAGTDQANRQLTSATPDANGNVTASLKLTRSTTVSAVFGGDEVTQPATVRSAVLVHASLATTVSKQYKTSGVFAYFHQTANPTFTTTMNAAPGRKQYLTVEYYSGGAWHLVKSGLYPLSSSGTSAVSFTGARKLATEYRARASYLAGTSGDSDNVTTYGAYHYFYFTK